MATAANKSFFQSLLFRVAVGIAIGITLSAFSGLMWRRPCGRSVSLLSSLSASLLRQSFLVPWWSASPNGGYDAGGARGGEGADLL